MHFNVLYLTTCILIKLCSNQTGKLSPIFSKQFDEKECRVHIKIKYKNFIKWLILVVRSNYFLPAC